jgi:hypothetical protein
MGKVDSRVLYDIQNGYGLALDRNADQSGGALGWEAMWRAQRSGEARDDELNTLVANAESASVAMGRLEARDRHATTGELLGLLGADTFRAAQRDRETTRTLATAGCASNPTCLPSLVQSGGKGTAEFVDNVFDERNREGAYFGTISFLSQSYNPIFSVFPSDIIESIYPS